MSGTGRREDAARSHNGMRRLRRTPRAGPMRPRGKRGPRAKKARAEKTAGGWVSSVEGQVSLEKGECVTCKRRLIDGGFEKIKMKIIRRGCIDYLKATAGVAKRVVRHDLARVAICSPRPRAPLFLPNIMSVRHSGHSQPQSLPPFAVAFSNSSLDRLSSHPTSLPPIQPRPLAERPRSLPESSQAAAMVESASIPNGRKRSHPDASPHDGSPLDSRYVLLVFRSLIIHLTQQNSQ
jgi:hypothetical protein